MKTSTLLLILFSINLVACLGDEAPDTAEPTQTPIITNVQKVGSAIEDCEKPLANYSNFQQVYNDCISWDESANKGTLNVKYRSDDATLPGLGVGIHYNSIELSLIVESTDPFTKDNINVVELLDTDDLDNDATTDKYINASWASVPGNWPGDVTINSLTGLAEIILINIDFNREDNSTENYVINYTSSSSATGVNLILGR